VLGTREFVKREFHAKERAKKYGISPVWHMQEREEREKIGVGTTYFFFSPDMRRNTREVAYELVLPFKPFSLRCNTPFFVFYALYF
jgi:hypothetical protein